MDPWFASISTGTQVSAEAAHALQTDGFVVMLDAVTPENGATCFLPGSHGMDAPPASSSIAAACGAAGSMIVFNGSVWHGHGPNRTDNPRRSIQGAYIRRTETSGETLRAR